jgi:hypothetical protein
MLVEVDDSHNLMMIMLMQVIIIIIIIFIIIIIINIIPRFSEPRSALHVRHRCVQDLSEQLLQGRGDADYIPIIGNGQYNENLIKTDHRIFTKI